MFYELFPAGKHADIYETENGGFLSDASCYIVKELFYELLPAGTHGDIYEIANGGFLPDASCYILKELCYELFPAGTHADIYETEDGGRCVLDAGGYIFNSEAHPIDPAALGDCFFYCKDQVGDP
jgi:hypothetical protein